MKKRILLAAFLGACTSQTQTTPLAQLQTTQLEIVTNGKINIELHVDETSGCPTLGDDATALFDGQPMQVSRGGYDTNASGCYPIAFWFDAPPMTAINGFEKTLNGSELIVHDNSATWSVDTVKLFANDFAIDASNHQIVWVDVPTISSAELDPAAPVTISGNTISYPAGLSVQSVYALSHPTPTRCDGPGVCTVSLQGYRNWTENP